MITVTRAELDAEPCDLMRWATWCSAWALVGFFVADLARRESALWSSS